MSGHPQQGHYDDGYGQGQHYGNTDSYYQDDHSQQYYDQNDGYGGHHGGGDGYYDES